MIQTDKKYQTSKKERVNSEIVFATMHEEVLRTLISRMHVQGESKF